MRRPEINKYNGKKSNIPVLYITQAIGIALGIDNKKLGLQRHFVEVKLKDFKPFIKKTEIENPQIMEEI
jgi:heterodisulfide reductase subunit B